MIYSQKITILPFLVCLLTLTSLCIWSGIDVFNTFVIWCINALVLFYVFRYAKRYFKPVNSKDYKIIFLFLIWALIGVVRGIFVAEGYWEMKQLVMGIFCLSLPVFVYAFSIPAVLQQILKMWVKYGILLFVLFLPVLPRDTYHFCLAPMFLLSCFLPVLPKKWRLVFIGLLVLMLFAEWGARSQIIKSAIVLMISIAFMFRKFISPWMFRLAHWACYILPVLLLYLGISGTYNIFEANSEKYSGRIVETKVVNGELRIDDVSADTRTFIYREVITSAFRHGYVLFGRTPARGNDSVAFGSLNAEDLRTGKYERYRNEVCHPNVFTWLGLVGLILWCLIYLKSSYLAVYKSNNIYMKFLGVFIAFRWLYGWIEDINDFNLSGISIWMIIAMGFSESFRTMNNMEFKRWILDVFKK